MMYQAKRQSAFMAALLFFVLSVFPVKRSEAVVPLVAAGMVMQGFNAAGAVVVADMLTAAGSALIGGTIVALAITPASLSDGSTPIPVRLPTSTNTALSDAAMPAPAAPSTGSGAGPTPSPTNYLSMPATGCQVGYDCALYQTGFSTLSTCMAWGQYTAGNGYCYITDGGVNKYVGPATPTTIADAYERSSCGAGYAWNGSVCALTNPRAALADDKADFNRTASGFVSALDADASKVASYQYSPGTGQIAVYGTGSDSKPRVITLGTDAGGNTTVRVQTQTDSVGGQSLVNTQTYTLSGANGQVLSYSGSAATGGISLSGSTPTVATGAAVGAVEAGATAGTSPIVFPSDYARTGEAANAANTVKTAVDQLKDKFTNTETVDDPTVPDWADHWGATFNPLKAWSMPGHASQCPVAGFGWNGVTYTIDSHCQLITDHWSGLQTAAVVVWTVTALFIMLGA